MGAVTSANNQPQALHMVQKGETLTGIARQYNMSVGRLRMLNNMPPTGNVTIRPGQRLSVSEYASQVQMPATSPATTLQPGTQNPTSGAFLSTPSTSPAPTQYNTTTPTPTQYNITPKPNPAPTTTPVVEDHDRFYETPVTGHDGSADYYCCARSTIPCACYCPVYAACAK